MKRKICISALLIVFALLVGCGSTQERRDSFYEKAKKALAAGELQDAQISVKNAIKIDPQFASGYSMLGDLQIQERNFANAYASYLRAVELDPNELNAQLGLCKLYYLQKMFDKVEEKSDYILSKQPDNVEASVLKAIALTKKGNTDEALLRLEALQEAHPDNIDVILARSEVYSDKNDYTQAENIIQKGLETNPNNILLHMHIANILLKHSNVSEAEKHYLTIVSVDTNNSGYNMLLTNFYLKTSQPSKAAAVLDQLIQRFPNEESYRLAQAQVAAQSGTAKEVEAVLVRAQKDIPGSTPILLALAEHYARTMQPLKAESLLHDIIRKNPDRPEAIRARRILASAYLAGQESTKAQEQLDEVLKRNPRDFEGHMLMGVLDLQKGSIRDAILELRQVVEDDPKSQKAFELLVRSHLLNNEGLQAESLLLKSLKDNPDNMPARMLLVETQVSLGKLDKALSELNILSTKDKDNPAIFITMGDVYALKRNANSAKNSYMRAAEVAPKEPLPYIRLGRLLWGQKDFTGAHEAFERALAISPEAKEAAESTVALFVQEKRLDDALKFAKQRVFLQPKDAFNNVLLGRVLMEMNNLAGAEQYFVQAIQLAPDAPAPYQLLGQLKLRQGSIKEGIAKFREAYSANPNIPSVGLALGMLLQVHNAPEEAKKVYEEILAKNPNYLPVMNNLAYLYAQDLPTSENLKKAKVLIERLKSVDSGESLDTVGWVQFKLGNKDDALATTLRAWDKSKGLRTVAYHLGLIYKAMGDNAKAARWFERALADNAPFPEREAALSELAHFKVK